MHATTPTTAFRDRLALTWGKFRRAYLITFRPEWVRRSLARRIGECRRSGACCQLAVYCHSLDGPKGRTACSIYLHRGPNCSLFPIDERDLRDRDRIMPDEPCGYRFIPEAEFARRDGNRRPRFAFPWEIDGNAMGGRIRRTTFFTTAISFLRTGCAMLRSRSRNGAPRGKQD
jgi:hypothetical protein